SATCTGPVPRARDRPRGTTTLERLRAVLQDGEPGGRVLRQLPRPGVPGGAPPARRRPDHPDRRHQRDHRRRCRLLTEGRHAMLSLRAMGESRPRRGLPGATQLAPSLEVLAAPGAHATTSNLAAARWGMSPVQGATET